MWSIGVDTGGTFTDLVAINTDGSIKRIKVPSTPSDPASAVFEALSRENFLKESSVDNIVIGTTIATNALLQRKGAKTLFITTKGFEDILFIQRIDRKGLYDLQWVKPKPYVERKHCIGVEERILSDGSVLKEITTEELKKLEKVVKEKLNEFDEENLPTIAISLLFSYVNNENEKKVADYLISKFPNVDISASYDVAPIWREYERGNTTTMDAYVKPIVSKFSKSLNDGLEEKSFSGRASLMKSNGGQVPLNISSKRPVEMVLSGLASGIISGAYYAKAVGSKKAVTLDMGGTSADVGVVLDGETTFSGLFEVEWGLPIAMPILDVTTIGAGGGSIAYIDSGGLLQVGPQSAGADPGPACYGKGGTEPTVTDANLLLGRLNHNYFLGGEVDLYPEKSEVALRELGEKLKLSSHEVAEAVLRLSNENMAGALRLVTVDRGYDYRDFDLIAYGGAAPLQASHIAQSLGMNRVIVPPSPGLVSAFGAVIAQERVDKRGSLVRRLDREEANDIPQELIKLSNIALDELKTHLGVDRDDFEIVTSVSCRYEGQNFEQEIRTDWGHVDRSFELALEVSPEDENFVERLAEEFHAAHKTAYGYDMQDQPIQSIYIGASAAIPVENIEYKPFKSKGQTTPSEREIWISSTEKAKAEIYNREDLEPGFKSKGPIIVEETDSTSYIPPGFSVEVDNSYALIIDNQEDKSNKD